jgi:hypothetical protein
MMTMSIRSTGKLWNPSQSKYKISTLRTCQGTKEFRGRKSSSSGLSHKVLPNQNRQSTVEAPACEWQMAQFCTGGVGLGEKCRFKK